MKWTDFTQLNNYDNLSKYLQGRERTHQKYFHYTTVSVVNKILHGKELWMSSVKTLNDIKDTEQFTDADYCFAFCWSVGLHENLPLWYLYSGKDGKGARISLTKNKMNQLIDCREKLKARLLRVNEDYSFEEIETLKDGEYVFDVGDVIYGMPCIKNSELYDLKYSTLSNFARFTQNEIGKYQRNKEGFWKGLIWFYEKETRFIIRIQNGYCYEYIKANPLERNDSHKYVVAITIPDTIINYVGITLGPEITDYNEIEKEQNIEISNLIKNKSKRVKLSDYCGTIEMKIRDNYMK